MPEEERIERPMVERSWVLDQMPSVLYHENQCKTHFEQRFRREISLLTRLAGNKALANMAAIKTTGAG